MIVVQLSVNMGIHNAQNAFALVQGDYKTNFSIKCFNDNNDYIYLSNKVAFKLEFN